MRQWQCVNASAAVCQCVSGSVSMRQWQCAVPLTGGVQVELTNGNTGTGLAIELFSERCDERALPLVGSRSESVWLWPWSPQPSKIKLRV